MKPQFETVAKITAPLGLSLDALAADLGFRPRLATSAPDEAVKRVRLASRVIEARKTLSSLDGALAGLETDLQPIRRRSGRDRRR